MIRGDDEGSVSAEFAVAMPAVIVVLALGVGMLMAGAQHVRLQDAAADAARLVARGEPESRAAAAVADAVTGAATTIQRRGDLVCVTASTAASLGGLIPAPLTATSCALDGGL
ncbi:MAG TPA: TadE family type IV pilus minor pilin [Microbacterium sp.]|uniref:TadE family type IV pilus minor pilin n=1 Tax=Microbacterium sp. TaxID=51671 RepID=UPI002C0C8E5E|nr:TadE family type IV pilus minor pilin [Microbacterium sp.]HWI32029.1 TadE family type IV pilus minor pilin [Microbacterium sp.]